MSQLESYTISPISASDTLAIRQQVLRPSLTVDQCQFEGDQDEATFHFGAFKDESLIGIATMMVDRSPDLISLAEHQYRLRGMAVLPEYRDLGTGGAILRACMQEVQQRGCSLFWCNARVTAARFYTAAGFSKTSETTFEITGAGPHFLMYKQL